MFQSLHLNNDIKQQTITDNFIVKHFVVYIISKYICLHHHGYPICI